ncbi:uncharacterized protein ARMOST_18447 [Armillaria ostoyae]|uniref:Uncharacterized protein n=1 Tax=Armillaria ostoyae TaxID=47428 RepID=A0A284S1T1_ARMOS|nr:uncharacterized protein ARMOST_18447 [Armillaria ostoyae]
MLGRRRGWFVVALEFRQVMHLIEDRRTRRKKGAGDPPTRASHSTVATMCDKAYRTVEATRVGRFLQQKHHQCGQILLAVEVGHRIRQTSRYCHYHFPRMCLVSGWNAVGFSKPSPSYSVIIRICSP